MLRWPQFRATLLVSVGFFLAGCGDGPTNLPYPTATNVVVSMPPITMTSGGGFDISSQTWKIAPDGSWTLTLNDRLRSHSATRSGRLTEVQRNELAVLAIDPALIRELRRAPGPCDVSDGPHERLEIGPIRYVANWCNEDRPRIRRLRERIVSLTAAS